MVFTKLKFYILFSIVFIIAILTPHIVHGHVLIPQQYAQSTVLLLDLILAYIFYQIYKREIYKINLNKKIIEKNLNDSYKYIGVSNNKMELINKFVNSFAKLPKSKSQKEKEIFSELLMTLVCSVAKSNKGLLRFIDAKQQKTLKEYSYHCEGDQFVVKLPNSKILQSNNYNIDNSELNVLQSDITNTNTKCVLCYKKNQKEKIDYKLLKILINQVHLLFLTNNKLLSTK